MRLMEALRNIEKEKLISFHMPGHKNGRMLFNTDESLMHYDITEIPGADHLHDSEACILETEQEIAKTYGAKQSRILVGGSTVGILSMILGTTKPGDRILVNRNAHKSVYNAIEINGLIPVYIYPEIDNYLGIPVAFDFSRFYSENSTVFDDIKICVLTYPTYEGLCYPIEEMIDRCHQHGIPVLVDEAHGAHLFLHEKGPKSALTLGADIVVQSFHKTLPAMTQTACLHISESNILSEYQMDKIDWYLKSLQSSSPSYVLMASIDQMLEIIKSIGVQYTKQLENNIEHFYISVSDLKHVHLMRLESMDVSKIIISISPLSYRYGIWDGYTLYKKLRTDFGIQCEYDSEKMILLMTSFCNNTEDFEALTDALQKLDLYRTSLESEGTIIVEEDLKTEKMGSGNFQSIYDALSGQNIYRMNAFEATQLCWESVFLNDAIGKVSAEYVIPYPPGIPILVPGELILKETLLLFPKSKDKIKIIK